MMRHITDSLAHITSLGLRLDLRKPSLHYTSRDLYLDDLIAALQDCPKLTHVTLRTSHQSSPEDIAAIHGLLSLPSITTLYIDLLNPRFQPLHLYLESLDTNNHQITPGLERLHFRGTTMDPQLLIQPDSTQHDTPLRQLKEYIVLLDNSDWLEYFGDVGLFLRRVYPNKILLIPQLKAMIRCGQLPNATMVRLLRPTHHYKSGQEVLVAYDLLAGKHSLLPRNAAWDANGEPLPWPHGYPCDTEDDDWGDSYHRLYNELCRQHNQPCD